MAVRDKLGRGEPVTGTMISEVATPKMAVMLAAAGMDFFIIDMEHGHYDWSEMAGLVSTANEADIAPVVRIPEVRRECILKPLDAGAAGLLVPMVESAEQVHEILRHAKYPPTGVRGAALRRAHSRYSRGPAEAYMSRANAETMLLVQIETRVSLAHIEEIASVEGLDGLFVGPFDLSIDLGIAGQLDHEEMWAAYRTVSEVAQRHGLVCGIQVFKPEDIDAFVRSGFDFCSVGGDVGMIVDQAARAVAQVQATQAG